MKRKCGVIFAVFGLIVFFFSMEGWAVDWVLIGESKDGTCLSYYDPQSIKRMSTDTVQVWEKVVFTEKGPPNIIKELGPKYKEVSYVIYLFEFNCSEKKHRLLSVTHYNQDGSTVSSFSYDSPS